jgi:hypothetical protein
MANDDQAAARGGLRPSMQPYGTFKRSYYRLTTSAAAVYIGQPMDLDGTGQAVTATAGTALTAMIVGACVGFARDSRGQMGLPNAMSVLTQEAYLPGNTDAYVCIADDPNQEFIIQEASTGTQLTTADIGTSIGFSYLRSASGSTVTGSSFAELFPIFSSATTSGALRLIALGDVMNSDGSFNSLGAYAKWRVRISNHRLLNPQASGVQ